MKVKSSCEVKRGGMRIKFRSLIDVISAYRFGINYSFRSLHAPEQYR